MAPDPGFDRQVSRRSSWLAWRRPPADGSPDPALDATSHDRWLKFGLGFALLVLLLTAALPFFTARSVSGLVAEVDRSERRLDTVSDTLAAMTDAETGQRGFLISGDDEFLLPYFNGVGRMTTLREDLRRAFDGSAERRELLAPLEVAIDQKLVELARTIALRRAGQGEAARSILETGAGKVYMDQIRERFTRLEAHERANLRALRTALDRRSRINAYVGLSVALPDLLLVGVFVTLLFRLAAQRAAANKALQASIGRALRAETESTRLAAIVESSNDAIIGTTLDGRMTTWNGAAEAFFGYGADEVIGQPKQMLIPLEPEADELAIADDLARNVAVPPFDTVGRASDGRLLELSVTLSPILDPQKKLIGISTSARDVSGQRRAEAALRESEARLRFMLDAAQIGDWDLNFATGVSERSLRHDRCFGYEVAQHEWNVALFIQHVHPQDRERVAARFQQSTTGLTDWSEECRVVWPDGSIHWIRAHGRIRQENGKPMHMLGIISDITQQKLAESIRDTALRLEAENLQIHEASRLKSQFLANMSHELRTPLNAIIGFAELMHSGAVALDSPRQHEFLGYIGASGHHLLQLINDVLDLSKVESGKFEFHPETVQLPRLIEEVAAVLRGDIERKKLIFSVNIDSNLADLRLDPARLKQVLFNYLSNAFKFTPVGGRVTVTARAEGEAHFRLEVADTGIGISQADLPRLFVDFQQLDAGDGKRHQGTGLGLALTRRLVQAQGGSVGVRSVAGVGSVFHVVLPCRCDVGIEQGQPQRPAVPPAAAPLAAPGELAPHRLLMIETDAQDRARLGQALTAAGFQVDAVSTGAQALQQAQARTYDAMTLDLLLPDQHGLDLLASIRSQGLCRGSPVVGVSMNAGNGSGPGTGTGTANGATFAIADILAKPIRTEEIVSAMARLRIPKGQRGTVMVIDDDALALDLMATALASIGIDAVGMLDGRVALRDLVLHRPDAIVLDLMMPGFDGFAVLDALARMPLWQDTPVFVWTSMILTDDEYASLSRSARAILSKGGGELAAMLDNLRRWRPPAVLPIAGSPIGSP